MYFSKNADRLTSGSARLRDWANLASAPEASGAASQRHTSQERFTSLAPPTAGWSQVDILTTFSYPLTFEPEGAVNDRRRSLRFDKVFTVHLGTSEGVIRGVGRNISAQGMFVETREALPLGEKVSVTFSGEDGTEITCFCEVRYQVALSYGKKDGNEGFSRGVGLKIVAYEVREDQPSAPFGARERVLH